MWRRTEILEMVTPDPLAPHTKQVQFKVQFGDSLFNATSDVSFDTSTGRLVAYLDLTRAIAWAKENDALHFKDAIVVLKKDEEIDPRNS